jgi:hypothetical protein
LLWAFEKLGYGRLVLDSRNEAASDLSSPGMEDLRLEVDERAVEGSSGSLVEVFLFVLFALVFVALTVFDFLSSRFSLTGNMAKSV